MCEWLMREGWRERRRERGCVGGDDGDDGGDGDDGDDVDDGDVGGDGDNAALIDSNKHERREEMNCNKRMKVRETNTK